MVSVFVLNTRSSFAQADLTISNKDIDTEMQLFYYHIFLDSTRNCKSKYRLLPNEIEVELWERIDSIKIKSQKLNYQPQDFYSSLKFEKKIFGEMEKKKIEGFLGYSFIINNPTHLTTDLTIIPTDSTALKYKKIKDEIDIKYWISFNKEHGVIFNIRPEWIFESNFTTSFILFQKYEDKYRAGVRINLPDCKRTGWAYFQKENGKWELDEVQILNVIGY